MAALDHAPQCAALADEVRLPDELGKRARPHTRGEWRVRGSAGKVERLLRYRIRSFARHAQIIPPRLIYHLAVSHDVNLRIPGPTPLPERVREAGARPMVNHRGPEFKELMNRVTHRLKTPFTTSNDILILTASGTGALEAAITNV